jgi:tRNA pseudouridine38-40 synthase
LRTVQGELEQMLSLLVYEPVELTCAGRTDAGVHARGQVAHMDVPDGVALDVDRVNRALPDDIRITAISDVGSDFDARFSALWRRYSYTVCDGVCDPLERHRMLQWNATLDVDRMNDAAAAFLGEHDFAGYCKQREGATTIRQILALRWERIDSQAVMHVQADAFCHSMVRSLVGAFLPVGDGRQSVEWSAIGLQALARQSGVTVMPPHPLVLEEVGYPPPEHWAERQHQTRTLRTR